MDINELLRKANALEASDLHIKVGSPPILRIYGELTPLTSEKKISHEDATKIALSVMSPAQADLFKRKNDMDLAYSVPGLGRFRCNIFMQRGTVGLVFRVIPMRIPTIEDLLLPEVIKKIAMEQRGLILVTGTTGSGKSTTLASMIDLINSTRTEHIMTIEDPIEYLHRDKKSIINQREIGNDTESFSKALRQALRQDPDVILVGEMRDFETIQTSLVAAETGHLVLSTLAHYRRYGNGKQNHCRIPALSAQTGTDAACFGAEVYYLHEACAQGGRKRQGPGRRSPHRNCNNKRLHSRSRQDQDYFRCC